VKTIPNIRIRQAHKISQLRQLWLKKSEALTIFSRKLKGRHRRSRKRSMRRKSNKKRQISQPKSKVRRSSILQARRRRVRRKNRC